MPQQDEVKLFLNTAHQALQQAEVNLRLGYYDVTTSRAYYAMFYAASALLASKDISRSKHSGVHSAFGQYFVRTGLIEREYAWMLGHAFDSRLDSDYDVTFTVEKELAEGVLEDARRFVGRIEQYFVQGEI